MRTLGSDRFDGVVTTDAWGLLAAGLSETLTDGAMASAAGTVPASSSPRTRHGRA